MTATAAATTTTGPGTLSVLHVAQPTDGGVARYVVDAAADQVARGWTVTVACPDTGWLAGELRRRGIAHVTWNARRAPGPEVAGETARLRTVVDDVAPDLVHLHSAKAGLAGRLALRGTLPTLFQPHGWSWLAATGVVAALSRRWEKIATRWADGIVCVGEGEAAHAEVAGLVGALRVVRNGVDLDRFRPADLGAQRAARAELGLSPTAPLAVCPARWARQKGQDVLLAAWAAVRAQCPDAQLALVGGDAPEDLELPEGVRLVGAVADVLPWLAAADVVVQPAGEGGGECVGVLSRHGGADALVDDLGQAGDRGDDGGASDGHRLEQRQRQALPARRQHDDVGGGEPRLDIGNGADVVVLPSRWEGLSLALLEAMAVGRSTVVTAIPGLAEVVDERVGATVPAEDADALAAALTRRLHDPALTLAEGCAAAAKATAELDARTTFDRLTELTAATAARARRAVTR